MKQSQSTNFCSCISSKTLAHSSFASNFSQQNLTEDDFMVIVRVETGFSHVPFVSPVQRSRDIYAKKARCSSSERFTWSPSSRGRFAHPLAHILPVPLRIHGILSQQIPLPQKLEKSHLSIYILLLQTLCSLLLAGDIRVQVILSSAYQVPVTCFSWKAQASSIKKGGIENTLIPRNFFLRWQKFEMPGHVCSLYFTLYRRSEGVLHATIQTY